MASVEPDERFGFQRDMKPNTAPRPNPFALPPPPPKPTKDVARYGIVASTPAVPRDEVESQERALEVVVMWGESSVLLVDHLKPQQPWWIGEPTCGEEIGFLVSEDMLGGHSRCLIAPQGRNGTVMIPPGSSCTVTVDGTEKTLAELHAEGRIAPSVTWPVADEFLIPDDAQIRIQFAGFSFLIRSGFAGKRTARTLHQIAAPLLGAGAYVSAVAAVVALFLTIVYFQPPSGAGITVAPMNPTSPFVRFAIEPEEQPPPKAAPGAAAVADAAGEPSSGEQGLMGTPDTAQTQKHFAVEGDRPDRDVVMAKRLDPRGVRTVGALGVLARLVASHGPVDPFGADVPIGGQPTDFFGGHLGTELGSSFGPFGRLGLRRGRGPGTHGDKTIASRGFETAGCRNGRSPTGTPCTIGGHDGPGDGLQRSEPPGPGPVPPPPGPVIQTPGPQGTADSGGLPKEMIRRVIRRHLNEVRFCYEQALSGQPDLAGRVTISFLIAQSGAVSNATVLNSSLNNPRVGACIATAARRWAFPQPENGGVVAVRYPFVLSPGN